MSGTRGFAAVCALAGGLVLIAASSASAASQVQLGLSPSLSQLAIIGEADDDIINVSVSGGTVTITDTGTGGITTAAADCTATPPNTVTCPVDPPTGGPIQFAVAVLGGGNDRYVNQNFTVAISQILGDAGNDLIESGPSDDFLSGGEGDDALLGGPGDDDLASDAGSDDMNGGTGSDTADFSNELAPVQVILDGLKNDGTGSADNVTATETVVGTLQGDLLRGDAGPNTLDGNGGDDVLVGGRGADELFGEAGDDHLTGGASPDGVADHLDCGSGVDVALRDARDLVEAGCERRGAAVDSDSARVRGKRRAKVQIACPSEEGATCRGKVSLLLNGKRVSTKGKFKVKPGKAANGKIALTKRGVETLRSAGGSLLVTVRVQTKEPGGSSISEARVLLTG